MRHGVVLAIVLGCSLPVGPAWAAEPANPSPRAELAAKHYEESRYDLAARGFEEEYNETKQAFLLFNIAECYRLLGAEDKDARKLRKAYAHYLLYLAAAPKGDRAVDARRSLKDVSAELKRRREPLTEPEPVKPPPVPEPVQPPPPPPPKVDLDPKPEVRDPVRPPPPPPPPPPVAPEPVAASPYYKRWWFWSIVGVAVAGAATTAFVVTGGSASSPPPQTPLGNLDLAFR
jgi:hypothetical protein